MCANRPTIAKVTKRLGSVTNQKFCFTEGVGRWGLYVIRDIKNRDIHHIIFYNDGVYLMSFFMSRYD